MHKRQGVTGRWTAAAVIMFAGNSTRTIVMARAQLHKQQHTHKLLKLDEQEQSEKAVLVLHEPSQKCQLWFCVSSTKLFTSWTDVHFLYSWELKVLHCAVILNFFWRRVYSQNSFLLWYLWIYLPAISFCEAISS